LESNTVSSGIADHLEHGLRVEAGFGPQDKRLSGNDPADLAHGRNDPTTALTNKGRDRLRNSLNTLKRLGLCGFNREFVWPVC